MLLKGYNWGILFFECSPKITKESYKEANIEQFNYYFLLNKRRRPCACVLFSSLDRNHNPDMLNKTVIWSESDFPRSIKYVMWELLSLSFPWVWASYYLREETVGKLPLCMPCGEIIVFIYSLFCAMQIFFLYCGYPPQPYEEGTIIISILWLMKMNIKEVK